MIAADAVVEKAEALLLAIDRAPVASVFDDLGNGRVPALVDAHSRPGSIAHAASQLRSALLDFEHERRMEALR